MHEEHLHAVLAALSTLGVDPIPSASYCPRCQSNRILRWGHFSGRQRYKCRGCARTFSALTGTSAAYSKRLDLWADYCRCALAALTLRRCAAQLDIALSTAFRWRHAILSVSRASDTTVLTELVEIAELHMAYSEKGARRPSRAPRRR